MQDLLDLGREIADELGGWSAQPGAFRGVELVGQNDGEKLHVMAEYHNPLSLVIVGMFPEVKDLRSTPHVRIGCSRDKGAAKIARDITRRLLPDYRVALASVLEFQAMQAGNTAQRELAMAEVSARLGGPHVATDGYYHSEVNLTGGVLVRGFGSIEANGAGDTMHLDLKGIPREVALRIVDVLAEARTADLAELLS